MSTEILEGPATAGPTLSVNRWKKTAYGDYHLDSSHAYPGTTVTLVMRDPGSAHRGARYRVRLAGRHKDLYVAFSQKGRNAGRQRLFSLQVAKKYGEDIAWLQSWLVRVLDNPEEVNQQFEQKWREYRSARNNQYKV